MATLLIFAAGPFVLWPLIKTPPEEEVISPVGGEVGRRWRRPGGGDR
ncbi:MAG TPA: hypothetical protein VFH00_00470 [Candidatus Nitrosotalea sp.]|nr:hypothetical protein [Candidatus Nitrosotalea sp.]